MAQKHVFGHTKRVSHMWDVFVWSKMCIKVVPHVFLYQNEPGTTYTNRFLQHSLKHKCNPRGTQEGCSVYKGVQPGDFACIPCVYASPIEVLLVEQQIFVFKDVTTCL